MSEDSGPDLTAIGFMFDASLEKSTISVQLGDSIEVRVRTVGDQPGHKQSGHYLWPASTACALHLVEKWPLLGADRVLELGSGCGLPALACCRLPGVTQVVCSDYDPGTLELINESFSLNEISVGRTTFSEWGDIEGAKALGLPFQLIVGSDLIYSVDVIRPLFSTVAAALAPSGVFVLVTSFHIGVDLDEVVSATCGQLQLSRSVVQTLDSQQNRCKIEYYCRQ